MSDYNDNYTGLSVAERALLERFIHPDNIALFNEIAGPGIPKIRDLNEKELQTAIKLTQEINNSVQGLIAKSHEQVSKFKDFLIFDSFVDMFPIKSVDHLCEAGTLYTGTWDLITLLHRDDNLASDCYFFSTRVREAGALLWKQEVKATDEYKQKVAGSGELVGISAFHQLIHQRSADPNGEAPIDRGVWSLPEDTTSGHPELVYLLFAGLNSCMDQWKYYWQWQQFLNQQAFFDAMPQEQVSEMNEYASGGDVSKLSASPLVGAAAQPLPAVV